MASAQCEGHATLQLTFRLFCFVRVIADFPRRQSTALLADPVPACRAYPHADTHKREICRQRDASSYLRCFMERLLGAYPNFSAVQCIHCIPCRGEISLSSICQPQSLAYIELPASLGSEIITLLCLLHGIVFFGFHISGRGRSRSGGTVFARLLHPHRALYSSSFLSIPIPGLIPGI